MSKFLGGVHGFDIAEVAVGVDEIVSALRRADNDICIMGSQSLSLCPQILAQFADGELAAHKRVLVTPVTTAERVFLAWRYGFNHVINVGLLQGSVREQMQSVLDGEKDLAKAPTMMSAREWLYPHNVAWVAHDEADLMILMELVDGRSNEEIANRVGLALQTVRNRVSRLMRDSGAHNRTQLALKMVR